MIVNASFRLAANAMHGKAVKGDLNIYSVASSKSNPLIIKDLVTFGMNTSFLHLSFFRYRRLLRMWAIYSLMILCIIGWYHSVIWIYIYRYWEWKAASKIWNYLQKISEASKVPDWYKYMSPTSYMVESKIQNFIFYIMCVVINIENYALNKFQAMMHFTWDHANECP